MKITSTLIAGAAVAGVASAIHSDTTAREVVTETVTGTTQTHKWGKFDKTSRTHPPKESGTHKWGKFNKTSRTHPPKESGTHKWGKFNKTSRTHPPKESGTHKWGKFNKTSRTHAPKESGTHKWGKFNKTSRTQAEKETGTHKWGKFNKTKGPVTTTAYVDADDEKRGEIPVYGREAHAKNGTVAHHGNGTNATHGTNGTNGTNGSNGSFSTTSHDNGAVVGGASFGMAAGVAAVALALL